MPIGSGVSRMAEDLSARDRQLVRRIEGGDEEAFRSLFATYAPSAMALAVRVHHVRPGGRPRHRVRPVRSWGRPSATFWTWASTTPP